MFGEGYLGGIDKLLYKTKRYKTHLSVLSYIELDIEI